MRFSLLYNTFQDSRFILLWGEAKKNYQFLFLSYPFLLKGKQLSVRSFPEMVSNSVLFGETPISYKGDLPSPSLCSRYKSCRAGCCERPRLLAVALIKPFWWPWLIGSCGFIAGFGGSIWQERKQKCSHKQGSVPKASRKCLRMAHKISFKELQGHMLSPGATKVQRRDKGHQNVLKIKSKQC